MSDWISPRPHSSYYRNRVVRQNRGLPFDDTNLKFPFLFEEYYQRVVVDFTFYEERVFWGWFLVTRLNPMWKFNALRNRDFDSVEGSIRGNVYEEMIPQYLSMINPLYKYKKKKLSKTFW